VGDLDVRSMVGELSVRIVYFIDHLRPDGAQKVLAQLVEGLAARGHEQAVVCLNDSWDAEVVERLQITGCEIRIVSRIALFSGAGALSTRRWLRQGNFETAITLLFYSDVLGRILAKAAGVPRILTYIQARNTNYAVWQRWLVRMTARFADCIVVCSEYILDFARDVEGADTSCTCVIPHGIQINSKPNRTDREAVRAEFNISQQVPLVGSLGRLTPQKGYDMLLEALASLPNKDIQALVAGTGEQMQELKQLAKRLGIHQRVQFVGFRKDADRILSAFDVYVQPSRFEGMPIAVLEAMAAGCPIVASAVDGNRDLIEDGVTGWLVQPEDTDALCNALKAALSNNEEAKKRGSAAFQYVKNNCNLEKMITSWEGVIAGE
jgi:glycosyltransferase involved in cell wall biosynthesis